MRIMVDMSATILHHGHTRLLKHAKDLGYVIVALTTDDEIYKKKGYYPELIYEYRKELLESIRYVDEVVPSEWELTQRFLDSHKVDFLLHGSDNSNSIDLDKLLIYPRTEHVSSSEIRQKAHEIYVKSKSKLS